MIKKYKFLTAVFFAIISLASCDKDDEIGMQSTVKSFSDVIEVVNANDSIQPGDTIWIEAEFKNRLVDLYSQEAFDLDNATIILSGFVNSLKMKYDSISFLQNSFLFVEDIGEFKISNLINRSNQMSFDFDIQCGKPLVDNKIRFGIVPSFQAIYAMEFKAVVFFGVNRTDYNDFSDENEQGNIKIRFANSNVNDSVYYNLPSNYRNYYDGIYNAIDISSKKFYFFDCSENNE